MKTPFNQLLTVVVSWLMVTTAFAQDAPVRTLFTNVHVFDGVREKRIENANVLIEDNLIAAVSTKPIEDEGATVIDDGGRTLMPGLSDCHWHMVHAYSDKAVRHALEAGFRSIEHGQMITEETAKMIA